MARFTFSSGAHASTTAVRQRWASVSCRAPSPGASASAPSTLSMAASSAPWPLAVARCAGGTHLEVRRPGAGVGQPEQPETVLGGNGPGGLDHRAQLARQYAQLQ